MVQTNILIHTHSHRHTVQPILFTPIFSNPQLINLSVTFTAIRAKTDPSNYRFRQPHSRTHWTIQAIYLHSRTHWTIQAVYIQMFAGSLVGKLAGRIVIELYEMKCCELPSSLHKFSNVFVLLLLFFFNLLFPVWNSNLSSETNISVVNFWYERHIQCHTK